MENLKVEDVLIAADEAYKKSQLKKGLDLCQSVLESPSKTTEHTAKAYFLMANMFHLQGALGKAIKAFEKVIEIDPTHTDASISLSVIYNDIGQYEKGQKIFEIANRRVKTQANVETPEDFHINKKFAQKHYELAEMYFAYNRYDEAMFEYNKVVKLDPENFEARVRIAKVYAKKGLLGKAMDELQRVKNEKPEFTPARIAMGVLHYGKGRILEARSEWERVLARNPHHQEAKMYLNLSKTATETRL